MRVNEILETCVYVDDLDAAEYFYGRVLGLKLVNRQSGRHLFFQCGRRMLLIFDPAASASSDSELPPHGATGPGHVAFAVPEESLDLWRSVLTDDGVDIEKSVTWTGGGKSIYFRDPAGNSLELATPRIWGIDETAALE